LDNIATAIVCLMVLPIVAEILITVAPLIAHVIRESDTVVV